MRFGEVDNGGVDGVHQPPGDLTGGIAQDELATVLPQADDRIGERETQADAERAEDDGQQGEAAGAGRQPVGDEGGEADLAADDDAVTATISSRSTDVWSRGRRSASLDSPP
ncbi:hypothetical protein [Amycolatopsis sp. H20-H5]|uniref:hypothetical protein n=1 Tax=Amycolatopsis sp. H20-H5 TaxID=3046309 RepID=UPI003FA3BBD5